jgi:hypothetical protein
MVEPIDALALSIHHLPGVYALLLGSGVSRSAGIPTGYEVTLKLLREIATSVDEDCEPDPEAWYQSEYSQDPNYSNVLEEAIRSQPERKELLRPYFELSADEREEGIEGLKVPTEAHKRIANLVAGRHVRVIMTTNFDTLMEQALDVAGVHYQVIRSSSGVAGALPLAHSDCTIVKLNGDYRDARIKNTVEELAHYEEPMKRLIDQILDEYGLIVCGWSADYDMALREAFLENPTIRFSTYWTARGEPRKEAEPLIERRHAHIMNIRDADSFFTELEEKVIALKEVASQSPATAKLAAATLKRYLPHYTQRIRTYDFVMKYVEKLLDDVAADPIIEQTPSSINGDELAERLQRYELHCEILLALMIVGCYWGEQHNYDLWRKVVERVAGTNKSGSGDTWPNMKLYPALLLLYGGGLAAVANERYDNIAALLTKPQIYSTIERKEYPVVLGINTWTVMENRFAQLLPGKAGHFTPLSEHLYEILREPLRELLPEDKQYERCFDRYEFLLAVIHSHLSKTLSFRYYSPIGCFGWRYKHSPSRGLIGELITEATNLGDDWPPLKAGLFGGSLTGFTEAQQSFDEQMKNTSWTQF